MPARIFVSDEKPHMDLMIMNECVAKKSAYTTISYIHVEQMMVEMVLAG